MTRRHPCFGPYHAKEHDDRWCMDCDRAWHGSEWAEQQAEARIKELEEVLRHALEWMEEDGCDCGTDEPGTCGLCLVRAALRAAEGKP